MGSSGECLGSSVIPHYINDIPSSICHSATYLFADDAKIIKSLSTSYDQSLLQEYLDSVNAWSIEWKIWLNAIKCSHLCIFFEDTLPEACYQVDEGTISDWKSYKDLGILVTTPWHGPNI